MNAEAVRSLRRYYNVQDKARNGFHACPVDNTMCSDMCCESPEQCNLRPPAPPRNVDMNAWRLTHWPWRIMAWYGKWADLPDRVRDLERRVVDLERKLRDIAPELR